MKVKTLIKGIEPAPDIMGPDEQKASHLTLDSREVQQGSLFAALPGTQVDGHQFISDAIENGARTILCEKVPETPPSEKVTFIQVHNSAQALGTVAANFYDNPSQKLNIIGVTGTNGKTTTCWLLYNLFRTLEEPVGLISTLNYRISHKVIESTLTTPDVIQLNRYFHKMVEEGCTHCFMEVSSHAITQHRIAGIRFNGAIFTNITHEHLDYHDTFDDYLSAKKTLFDALPEESFALYNADDENGETMVKDTVADSYSYSLKTVADFRAKILESDFSGLKLSIDNQEVHTPIIGKFNAYNFLACYGTATLLGLDQEEILTGLTNVQVTEGRFDYVTSPNNVKGIVDYAHSPDALEKVLQTIHDIRSGSEMVITVIGCGGDRDKQKRPKMAQTAVHWSDKVILTSDNPRSEEPNQIIQDMKEGLQKEDESKTLTIPDREEAIKTAGSLAREGDIILVAGKGHEKVQIIDGEKRPFNDKAVLKEALNIHNGQPQNSTS